MFALVIGSYNCPQFVELQIRMAKRNLPGVPILIADDCSPCRKILQKQCKRHGVDYRSNPTSLGYHAGDIAILKMGIQWAEEKRLGLVVKVSQRFCVDIPDWMGQLPWGTNYVVGQYHNSLLLRTECIGFEVSKCKDLPFTFESASGGWCEQQVHSSLVEAFGPEYLGIWHRMSEHREQKRDGFLSRWANSARDYMTCAATYGMNLGQFSLEGWNRG